MCQHPPNLQNPTTYRCHHARLTIPPHRPPSQAGHQGPPAAGSPAAQAARPAALPHHPGAAVHGAHGGGDLGGARPVDGAVAAQRGPGRDDAAVGGGWRYGASGDVRALPGHVDVTVPVLELGRRLALAVPRFTLTGLGLAWCEAPAAKPHVVRTGNIAPATVCACFVTLSERRWSS